MSLLLKSPAPKLSSAVESVIVAVPVDVTDPWVAVNENFSPESAKASSVIAIRTKAVPAAALVKVVPVAQLVPLFVEY